MPNRLLREGLMESERVLSMPVEARWLFVVIILSADDIGLFEATEFKLARRADVNRELAGKLMMMLADADLVRFYVVDGKRYGFIPRFRQRIQIKRARHPLPPDALLIDDQDAFGKIKHLSLIPTDGQPLGNGCAADGQPSEPEPEVEVEVGIPEEAKASSSSPAASPAGLPACPHRELIAIFTSKVPELPEPRVEMWDGSKGARAMASRWKEILTKKRAKDGSRYATNKVEGVDWFGRYFDTVSESDFLTGRNGKGGHFDLTWLMKSENFVKVMQGNYVNREAA